MRITVIGARGFIGSAIARAARERGHDVVTASHDRLPRGHAGTVIFCSGLATGSEERPVEAYALHVCAALEALRTLSFERFIYISSTRVYDGAASTQEDAELKVIPQDLQATYATSKIGGEAAVLAAGKRNVVVRLSNVFGRTMGAHVFLGDIIHQAVTTGRIRLRTALDSSKDYVDVDDAANVVLRITIDGTQRVYNVASGRNTTHGQITKAIAAEVPVQVVVESNAPVAVAPQIDVGRVRGEFDFNSQDVLDTIPEIVRSFQARS